MRHHRLPVRRVLLSLCLFVLAVPLIASAGPIKGVPTERTRSDQVILRFEGDAIPVRAFERLEALGYSAESIVLRRYNTILVPIDEDQDRSALADTLSTIPGVRIAAVSGTMSVQENIPPNDPAYSGSNAQAEYLGSSTTYPHSIDMERVWGAALNGSDHTLNPHRAGVTVAVIDTGVNSTLREHTGEYVGVWDYCNNDNDPSDDFASRHGTLVASMMRASGDNGYGLVGSMYGSRNKVLVYKTVPRYGLGEDIDTMEAMMDAADRGARVINVSLGGSTDGDASLVDLWNDTVDYCTSQGALVVAAAGNNSGGPVLYPAAADGALAVGSISRTGTRSSFSNRGPELDVVAMGEKIWGAYDPTGSEQTTMGNGTSFATPLVSGAAAFLWSCIPDMTPAEMHALLKDSAVDYPLGLGDGDDDEYGAGRIDAWAAYQALITNVPEQPALSISSTPLEGFETTLSWNTAPGSDVFYHYGIEGGPSYLTDSTSGRLSLPADGPHTVFVEAFSNDRWAAASPATMTLSPSTGLKPLASTRLQGANRYATAAQVSLASHPEPTSTVLIASGENWPDALSAGPLAATVSGPLLLTRPASLPVETRDEIVRLHPNEIIIIGGASAVNEEVANDIALLMPTATVRRMGGSNRYDTARLVALELETRLGGSIPARRAIIVSGENYPDALSGSPVASAAGWPVLLTRTQSLPAETLTALTTLDIDDTVVLGGTAAVSAPVASALPDAVRVHGDTRYTTSRAIADWAWSEGVLTGDGLGLATGLSFPDALAAGAHLSESGSPVVLIDGITGDAQTWLEGNHSRFGRVIVLGGKAAVSHETEFDAKAALRKL